MGAFFIEARLAIFKVGISISLPIFLEVNSNE